jgi:hypothetical protein
MPISFQETGSESFKPSVVMLVYGHGGVGKTTFACSAPNAVVADCEGGTKYLGRRGINAKVARIQTWQDIEEFYLTIAKDTTAETIVIDPVNEALEKLLASLKKNKTFTNAADGLTLQGWGVAKDKMRQFLKALRDLGKHVIVIAHVAEEKDEDSSLKKRPRLAANLSQELIDMMDIVAFMDIAKGTDGEVKRILRVQPESDKFEAKDRTNTLGPIVEPDFKKIIEAVVENKQFSWTKKTEAMNAEFEDSLPDPDGKSPEQVRAEGFATPAEDTTATLQTAFGGQEKTAPRDQMLAAMKKAQNS